MRSLLLLSLLVSQAASFGLDPAALQHAVSSILPHTAAAHPHSVAHQAAVAASTPPAFLLQGAQDVLDQYKHALSTNPLPTKMATGATLAMCGDAIAQSKEEGEPYDVRRAASFGTFDMAYRALQHASFPWIVAHCQGQFLGGALSSAFASVHLTPDLTNNLAALEQTLASQLGIVPFLYYPVFFALTGFMQGLTLEGSIERAQEKFLPLMQRNLLFWIPVQFIQFGFIQEDLQIPFLSVCGLAWTFLLSIMAGNAAAGSSSTKTSYEESEAELMEDSLVLSQEQLEEVTAAVVTSQQQPVYESQR